MTGLRFLQAALLAVGLSACGASEGFLQRALTGEIGISSEGGLGRGAEGDVVVLPAATASLDLTGPLMRVTQETSGAFAGVAVLQKNGAYWTWAGGDGASLTTRSGLVTATRGVTPDLMRADVAQVEQALRRGQGQATRAHTYLDGLNQEYTRALECQIASRGPAQVIAGEAIRNTRHLVETCTGIDLQFQNEYWIGADGTIWLSRQWVNPEAGMFRLERFRK